MYLADTSSGAVLGQVLDFESVFPIDGAIVTAINQDTGSEYTGITAADGTFFITSLPSGWYTIRATGTGFEENFVSDYPIRIPNITAEPVRISLVKTGAGNSPQTLSPSPPQPILRENSRKAESLLEVHIRWDASVNAPPVNTPALEQNINTDGFTLIKLWRISGSAPRQRSPELSSNQLLIVITDGNGEQRAWTLIPDPRIIRAESPGPTGELSGHIIYRSKADFFVTLPESLPSAGLKIYQPRWTGMEFSLNLLGTISLP